MLKAQSSFATGFLLAARLHRLVAAVWLVWGVIFLPVLVAVKFAVGPQRANLPVGHLDAGEELLVFFEIMRPIVVPLAVVFGFAIFLLIAWCILWHAAVVRWWLHSDTAQVRIAEVIGQGLPVWWRFTRLALLALILQSIVTIVPWLPFLTDVEQRFVLPLLVCGAALVVAGTILVWLSTFRGGWTLGEAGRRSAVAAWIRGFGATVRRPLRSLFPLLIWGFSGLGLLVLPLLYDGPMATTFLFVAWLLAAFFVVALFMSYAPPKPRSDRPVSPLEPPGPFTTTRFPVMWGEDER
jgi:hypothetical protein